MHGVTDLSSRLTVPDAVVGTVGVGLFAFAAGGIELLSQPAATRRFYEEVVNALKKDRVTHSWHLIVLADGG